MNLRSGVILLLFLTGLFVQVPVAGSKYPTEVEKVEVRPIVHSQLLEIARCESENNHFDKDGSVLRGKINNQDVGRFQINLEYHEKDAVKLGYDLFTEEGNTNYAVWLYEKEGSKPWNWSKHCWGKT